MMPTTFDTVEGFTSNEARRKRLGQYYTSLPVARLLVALASHRIVRSVVDPMGGRGNMLQAARSNIASCKRIDGIEIDPLAHAEYMAITGDVDEFKTTYLLGSAFDASILSCLAPDGYDMVITNPPYVRYQSQKSSTGSGFTLPSALEVRNGLCDCLSSLAGVDEQDRHEFLKLARIYSGLSDLAVPSWILCAALVKVGGTLAMVVPDAWLNRDYASVIRYLLLRWFQIEYIVEDAHATWFPGVQIKTTLLVAKRIPRRPSIRTWNNEKYLHITLPSNLGNEDSLLGRSILGNDEHPEITFARYARDVLEGKADHLVADVSWQRVKIADQAAATMASTNSWFAELEEYKELPRGGNYMLPPILASWFGDFRSFTTLGEIGAEVGQGLRTGANGFFYVERGVVNGEVTTVTLSSLFGNKQIEVPTACVHPVVRKQVDISDVMAVDTSRLRGAVLAFHRWALPEHAREARATPLPSSVSEYIKRAATITIDNKALPTLTAVAPNARKANSRTGAPARFWYMLPSFALRHSPDLFIARVNSDTPRVVLNPEKRALIDANFSTIWLRREAAVTVHAVFALLNSSLAVALYEHLGGVMGGGALKLEATHLRSMPLPCLPETAWKSLDHLGASLEGTLPSRKAALIRQIDELVCREMFGGQNVATKVAALHLTIRQRQAARWKE